MANNKREEGYQDGLDLTWKGTRGTGDGDYWKGVDAGYNEHSRREQEHGARKQEVEEHEENKERRHRELLEALKSQGDDDTEDYVEEYEEEDLQPPPPMEPLIYSEKTRRASGMDWLKNVMARIENEHFFWGHYGSSDADSGYDGSSPDGRHRIRIQFEPWLTPAEVKTILVLEDFCVLSSYCPLSEEEKQQTRQLASQIYKSIQAEEAKKQAAREAAEIEEEVRELRQLHLSIEELTKEVESCSHHRRCRAAAAFRLKNELLMKRPKHEPTANPGLGIPPAPPAASPKSVRKSEGWLQKLLKATGFG